MLLKSPPIFGVFWLLAAAASVNASPDLYVVAPNILRVNSDEDVWVTVHHTHDTQAAVKVYLETYPDRSRRFSERNIIVGKDESKKVAVKVGWNDLPRGSQQTFVYLVAECGALQFKKESVILISRTSGYTFLQTDKPLYKPHEKVNILVVSLDTNMKPSSLTFSLDIINPNGDVVNRMANRIAADGFVKETFALPKVLVYGNWTLQATYKDNLQPEETKTSIQFEVKEYVLPTFSVKVKVVDDYILDTQPEVKFKIQSNYVFGTPVKGRARVYCYLLSKENIELAIWNQSVEVNGEHLGSITQDKFKHYWSPPEGTRLLVKVTMTEGATGKQESSTDSSAVFVKSPYVISYEKMPKYFRPGLAFTVKAEVMFPNKKTASRLPISIEAMVTVNGRQQGAHSNQRTIKSFTTNENGRIEINLDIDENAGDLTITLETHDPIFPDSQQGRKPITLMPHTSRSGQYLVLQLSNSGSKINVNNNLEVRVSFTADGTKKINFMVVARGKILQHFTQTVNDRTAHTSITISPLMSPQARVIAYYSSGTEIISDSLLLEIVKACGSELTINTKNGRTDFSPEEKVTITVNAGAGSTVSLLGVDKAVYLLSEKDILTRSKMFKMMVEMDIGCGPGGGRDTSDVFKQAGLSVLVNTGMVILPRRNSEGCPKPASRRRRNAYETYTDIIAGLSAPDKVCCTQGRDHSGYVTMVTKTCQELITDYGARSRPCAQAYLRCCAANRRDNDRGRSIGGSLDSPVNEKFDVEPDRRHDFRETWIFEQITLGAQQRSVDVDKAFPHSITTWVISGVSVTPDNGMCVAVPKNITATKKFFVHVDLPYSAVRTEQLQVKATVYNLGDRSLRVHVSLKADDSICYAAAAGKYTFRQEITLEAKSAKTVTFPIVPLKVKSLPAEIHVKALTSTEGDEVIKKLRIKHEGRPRRRTESIPLDPAGIMGGAGTGANNWKVTTNKAQKTQTIEIPLIFPDDTIPNTQACSLSIHGNLLGQMVPSADFDVSKLINLPTGCGEQNMMTMGPLVYAMKYLLRTGKLTAKLESVAYDHITKGYQSQLAYKKKDGSYAAWTYYPSSSWLTAFVTKVFCQASTFDQIGQKVKEHVIDAVKWLFHNAMETDGRFRETHVVIHKEMLGQTVINDVTLTSFIVECIARCKNVINLSSRDFAQPMRKAVQYLERHRQSQMGNPYSQAILAYALTLMDSPHKIEANNRLRSMSSFDPVTGMRYWSLDGKAADHNTPSWYNEPSPAAAIETSSYALLTQLALGDEESYFTYSGPIASWLIRQRTKSGSFSSTTDTVLGLEALSEYAFKANSRSNLDMEISLFAGGNNIENHKLEEATALIPIFIEDNLPIGDTLHIIAKNEGLAQLQLECSYNSPPKDENNCPFFLEVLASEYKATSSDLGNPLGDPVPDDDRSRFGRSADKSGASKFVVSIQIRVRYTDGQMVGMSILDVSLFTGFVPIDSDLKKLKEDKTVQDYEKTGSSVLFYLPEIKSHVDTIISFKAVQEHKIGRTQPVAVKVYDYYEPNTRQCTKFYHPLADSALLAQSCENSQGRKVCECIAGTCADYWGFDRTYLPRGRNFNVKTRNQLYDDACNIYDYAVKVKAGQTFVNKPIKEMMAEIVNVIKLGGDNFDTGEMIRFVWNSECPYPMLEDGVTYLIMGKDGQQLIGKDGRAKTKYKLDSSSYVVRWYGVERKKYMNALNAFASKLVSQGCGQ